MVSTNAEPILQNYCVNCSIRFHKNVQKHVLSDTTEDVRQLIHTWISRDVNQQDAVCRNCYEILQESIRISETTRRFGHRNICVPCGSLILKAHQMRSVPIDSAERNIILQNVPPHQVERIEQVCMACWMKSSRAVNRHKQQDDNRAIMIQQFEIEDINNTTQLPTKHRYAALTVSKTSSTITGICLIIAMLLLFPITLFFDSVKIN